MRRLELVQQHEGLVSLSLGQPINTIVFNDLGTVALVFCDRVRSIDAKLGLEIGALSTPIDEDFRVVETSRLRAKVPLADDRSLIAVGLTIRFALFGSDGPTY